MGNTILEYKIGQGFDAHRFGDGDHVVIGGVRIPHERGLVAHSDGDVLLHAVCDAILGAAGLGDIGAHFPDSDPEYRDIDSRELLRACLQKTRGWRVCNLDCTVIAQRPRLAEHIPAMRAQIAEFLWSRPELVNVKATTTEGLGFPGREEGIAAQAVVLLQHEAPRPEDFIS